jgi:hypothetical protein
LLESLARIAEDADADADTILGTFLPGPQHRRALDHRVLVVRGERGAGKTALFQLLHALQRRQIRVSEVVDGAPDGKRMDGFSAQGTGHPPPDVVEQFGGNATPEDLRAFWLGHLVGRLHIDQIATTALPEPFGKTYLDNPIEPAAWVASSRATLPSLYAWLDALERTRSDTCYVVYDHLDRIGTTNRLLREKVAAALLDLWLSLSQRYERIRGKVLLREDIFQATLTSFSDATKLDARSVRLDWSPGRLFAMLVRQMAGQDNLRTWLKEVAGIDFAKKKHLGWMPQTELDDRAQRAFGKALVGPYMGAGPTKGFSHTWLINHLQDAHQHVTPRTLVVLVQKAAEFAGRSPKAKYRRLLHPSELQRSLEAASKRRVSEISTDYPVVGRLEGLRGKTLFLSRREVVQSLRNPSIRDGFTDDLEGAFEELIRIGVLVDREDGRIDVPDVYRYGFEIKRKGGTKRVS